ncbi:MAG: NAD-dependent DNA ligase LigA [Lachnospiraceae bacterium]
MNEKIRQMREWIETLNEAGKAYYQEDREIMSNLEYDALYDKLKALEEETGIVLSNSPTIHVGYEVLGELEKETHEFPMLSLDKTKDRVALSEWLGEKEGILSWKLDGLTVVLIYKDGQLKKAVTRGNGEIGEVITNNARVFQNIPEKIPFTGELVLRGEAIITYSDFEKINAEIGDVKAKYKNPRNLCSGSVRQLNNEITANRRVRFYAFALVKAQGREEIATVSQCFAWMRELGFDVVEYKEVTAGTILETVAEFEQKIPNNDIPSDGLVLIYNDIAYGNSLGRTAKFPRNSIAFKWRDEVAKSHLLEVEWSPSRTGLINPVAIFEPVELEGTSVSRASLHNISILRQLKLGIGDEISIFKANMIIPQVAENFTQSDNLEIPAHCPACGGETIVKETNDVQVLYCGNPLCSAKKRKLFAHYVGRNAMNIDGLSQATIDKMIEKEFLTELSDLYTLSQWKEQIIEMEGFGKKSYENLINSIEKSRHTTLPRFLFALGILNVGLSNAKLICKAFSYDLEKIRKAEVEDFVKIDGIGEVIAKSIVDYFANEHNERLVDELLSWISFEQVEIEEGEELKLANQTFVITGTVNHFKNRNELKEKIESLGAKVTGSVTKKTTYLINNDKESSSSKNKKAKELGISIISEEDFLEMIGAAE